jgi:hypothetical protein
VVGELVLGDAEQPRRGGRRRAAEAAARHERGGERLRGQVGGGLGVAHAALEVADQHLDVAVVEAPEVLRIVREEEVLVALHDRLRQPSHERARL